MTDGKEVVKGRGDRQNDESTDVWTTIENINLEFKIPKLKL